MRVVDRALGIGKRVATDASVICLSQKYHHCSHFSPNPSENEPAAAQFEVISTRLPGLRDENAITNTADDKRIDITAGLVMRREDIHSLLTVAAERGEPGSRCR